jgi:hypothetical protein
VELGIRFVKAPRSFLFRIVIVEKIDQDRKSTCGGAVIDEQLKYATPSI